MIECPKEIMVEMREEDLLEDMDGYDPDSYNEDSIDWLGVEIGNSMETLIVSDWNEVKELMDGQYKKYVFSDDDVAEAYEYWLEENGLEDE